MMQPMTVAQLMRALADIPDHSLPVEIQVQEKGSHWLRANVFAVSVSELAWTRPNGQRGERVEVVIEGHWNADYDRDAL